KCHNRFCASLILAPIWALWHWPLWFFRERPHPSWPFHYFLLLVIPLAFLFTWLYIQTRGSVLAAILFHAAINTTILFVPMLPPRHPGLGPFALWIGVTWVVAVAVVWSNRDGWFSARRLNVSNFP